MEKQKIREGEGKVKGTVGDEIKKNITSLTR